MSNAWDDLDVVFVGKFSNSYAPLRRSALRRQRRQQQRAQLLGLDLDLVCAPMRMRIWTELPPYGQRLPRPWKRDR